MKHEQLGRIINKLDDKDCAKVNLKLNEMIILRKSDLSLFFNVINEDTADRYEVVIDNGTVMLKVLSENDRDLKLLMRSIRDDKMMEE